MTVPPKTLPLTAEPQKTVPSMTALPNMMQPLKIAPFMIPAPSTMDSPTMILTAIVPLQFGNFPVHTEVCLVCIWFGVSAASDGLAPDYLAVCFVSMKEEYKML